MQRRAMIAVALVPGLFAPSAAMAQSRNAQETPRLLVAVFESSERAAGVQVADAVRNRVSNESNQRTLLVIPKNDITVTLESSGYRPDSSLGNTDLRELGRILRADEILSGLVSRSPDGALRIEPRLMLARDPSLAQPLPAVETNNVNDAARNIERALNEARKQLPDNRRCENHIRAREFDRAVAAANEAIRKFPSATIARLCLATAYQGMQLPPDSILRVTDEIRRLDPKNSFALRVAFGAYQTKGDQESAVRALVALLALEPNNTTLQGQVVTELAKLGKPTAAIPIVDSLLVSNPGDPQLLRQKWLLTLAAAGADTVPESRAALLRSALTAGEEMTSADTSLADSVYFERQIAAAAGVAETEPQRAVEFASRAVQKFPSSTSFWFFKAQAERRAGQLQMAKESINRVLAIDAKYPNAGLMLAQIFVDLNQADSVVALAERAIAAGEDSSTWGAFLLAPTQAAFLRAQETKAASDYDRALALAQQSDKLAPSPTAKFFIGVAAFQIGIDALQQAQGPLQQMQRTENARQQRALKQRACPFARKSQEMMLLTQTNMPAGGAVDAETARQILGYVTQYAPAADQMAKVACE